MDLATVIGYVTGVVCVVFIGIGIPNLPVFYDTASFFIVLGGGLAATMISCPLEMVTAALGISKHVFFHKADSPMDLIKRMVEFAEIARRDGILALENVTDTIQDPFLVKGIQLAVDGTDPELIEQIMNTELENIESRHGKGRKPYELFTKYAPAWGMIGTLIGLINMLSGGMDDPAKLSSGMAVALITTMYGAVVANYACGPIADKLILRNQEEMLLKEIVLRGVMSIQSGDNPRIVEQKLKIFLPPKMRDFGKDS
jgi:chemotaxis protein MotA